MPQTTAETTARRVDALYRAHLLRAAAERIPKMTHGPVGSMRRISRAGMGAAQAARAAARTQEIRAEHTGNDAAARVAVLIGRAR